MGWFKRILSLEKRLKNVEWDINHRNCKEGNHSFEMVISPYAKCKHCETGGKVTAVVRFDKVNLE